MCIQYILFKSRKSSFKSATLCVRAGHLSNSYSQQMSGRISPLTAVQRTCCLLVSSISHAATGPDQCFKLLAQTRVSCIFCIALCIIIGKKSHVTWERDAHDFISRTFPTTSTWWQIHQAVCMHTDLMLVPLPAVQWFAIANLALEARQHILQSCNAAYVLSTGSRRVLAVLPLYFSVSFSLSPSPSLNHTKTNQGQKYCSLALFLQLITRQCMLNLHLLATKITPR